jgi:hypothetical protein
VGDDRSMRRCLTVLAAAGSLALIAAPAASAAPSDCPAPDHPAWHSCLSAGHRAVGGTNNVRLTRVTAKLVIRVTACPANVIRRKVQIRTKGGDLIARKRVTGRCGKRVIRYKALIRPNVELKVNTVIRSFWSQIPDEGRAPSVKLKVDVE